MLGGWVDVTESHVRERGLDSFMTDCQSELVKVFWRR